MTAAAATPTPVNNESAGAEGAEFIAHDLSQDPPGNDDLLKATLLVGHKVHPRNTLPDHNIAELLMFVVRTLRAEA